MQKIHDVFPVLHVFLLDSLNINTHICTATLFVMRSKERWKKEKEKAKIGFKAEENNSELTLTLIREDLGGYGL